MDIQRVSNSSASGAVWNSAGISWWGSTQLKLLCCLATAYQKCPDASQQKSCNIQQAVTKVVMFSTLTSFFFSRDLHLPLTCQMPQHRAPIPWKLIPQCCFQLKELPLWQSREIMLPSESALFHNIVSVGCLKLFLLPSFAFVCNSGYLWSTSGIDLSFDLSISSNDHSAYFSLIITMGQTVECMADDAVCCSITLANTSGWMQLKSMYIMAGFVTPLHEGGAIFLFLCKVLLKLISKVLHVHM